VRLVKDAMAGGDSSLGLVRELRMMRHLRGHDNVVQVSENTARFGASVAAQLVRPPPSVPTDTSPFVEQVRDLVEAPPGRGAFKDIYIVTQLDTSLDRVLADQQLTEACVGAFAHQILRGLKYLHSADIIHGDLKPSVLRVSASGQLRISDIGHARLSDGDDFNTYYGVVKMYRAPEVLLAAREHGKPIDTWSVGCILAEMIAHKKLFDSNHPVATIKLQLEKVGFPKPEDQQHLPAVARKRLMDLGPVQPSPGWKKLLPQVPGGVCARARLCARLRACQRVCSAGQLVPALCVVGGVAAAGGGWARQVMGARAVATVNRCS
jgi:serine/threonine protein kinase